MLVLTLTPGRTTDITHNETGLKSSITVMAANGIHHRFIIETPDGITLSNSQPRFKAKPGEWFVLSHGDQSIQVTVFASCWHQLRVGFDDDDLNFIVMRENAKKRRPA
jgi:hypothetical protein